MARGGMRSTWLQHSPELQTVMSLAAEVGPELCITASVLKRVSWDFEKAARILGVQEASIRQRVTRLRAKLPEILPGFTLEIRRRAVVRFGLDDSRVEAVTS